VGCIRSVHPREQGIWTWGRTRVRPVEGAGDSPAPDGTPSKLSGRRSGLARESSASPQSDPAESGQWSPPWGTHPDPMSCRPPRKTPGQRPDLNKCTDWTHGDYVSAVAAGVTPSRSARRRGATAASRWSRLDTAAGHQSTRSSTLRLARRTRARPTTRVRTSPAVSRCCRAQRLRRRAVGPAAPRRGPGVFTRRRPADQPCCGSRAVVRAAPGGG
jgi:hypothetical protein